MSTFQSVRGADAPVRRQNGLPTPAYRIRNPSPKELAILISDRKKACHSDRRDESLFNKACHPDRSGGPLLSEESQIRPATWEIFPLETPFHNLAGGAPFPRQWFPYQNTHSVFLISLARCRRCNGFVQSGKGRDRKRTGFSAKRNGADPRFSARRIRAPVIEPAVCRTGRQIVGRKLPYADVIVG